MILLHNGVGEGAYAISRKEREVPKLILAVVAWLYKLSSPLRVGDANPGWLGRHNSRRPYALSRAHEPYVDLGPLDLTRTRH
jgi:hypothetical protein